MFDRVAELGIDLMLAGHTHGGQLSLDFVHRGLNLSHLIYDYTSGWYEKNGAQLYVNRGIVQKPVGCGHKRRGACNDGSLLKKLAACDGWRVSPLTVQ